MKLSRMKRILNSQNHVYSTYCALALFLLLFILTLKYISLSNYYANLMMNHQKKIKDVDVMQVEI